MALPTKAVVGPLFFCLVAVTATLSDASDLTTGNAQVVVGEGARRMLPRSSNGKHLLSATLDHSEEQGGARRMLPKSGAGKHLLSATVDLSEEQDSGSRRMLPAGKGSGRHLLEDVAEDVAVAPAGEAQASTVTASASTPQPDQISATPASDPATSQVTAEAGTAAEDAAVTTPTPVEEAPAPRVLPAGAIQITAEDLPDCSGSPDECAKAFHANLLGQSGSTQEEHGADTVQTAWSMAGSSFNYAGCASRYEWISCNDAVLCPPRGYGWPNNWRMGIECDCLDFCRDALRRPFGVCWAAAWNGAVWYSITTSTGAIYCDPRPNGGH